MGAEMPQRPRKEADGIRHEPGLARQAPTAAADSIGPQTQELMEEVLRKANLHKALKKVIENKGAPGIDGMTVEELPGYLRDQWPVIREQLLNATYVPAAVRRVDIPKPSGGHRMLGIPTTCDRFLQQALAQVMDPIFDPGFSNHSYGYRRGRSAQQAVRQARDYMAEGYRWVVDIDLEKFFDRVNHDILMSRVARKIEDKRVLKLIRGFLTAGIMMGGVVSPRATGTPQGGPLSPLLSNILLDEYDKELERRGHRFCRYADDSNIYVRSKRAGERLLASLTVFLAKRLRLKVNESKSTVDRPWKRKFLGYTVTNHRSPRLKPAPTSVQRAKDRIRQITHAGRGRNIRTVIEGINLFTRGWFGYYQLTTVKLGFDTLDQWIRRRLRRILWEQWKTPKTRYRKLVELGVEAGRAKKASATGRGDWFNAGASHMHAAVPNRRLTEWGLESLLQRLLDRQ